MPCNPSTTSEKNGSNFRQSTRIFFLFSHFLSPVALNMQPKFLVLEVQKITNFLELTFFLDLAGCALVPSRFSSVVLPIFGSTTDKFRELYPPRLVSQHQSSSKWLAPCCAPRSLLSGARTCNTNDDHTPSGHGFPHRRPCGHEEKEALVWQRRRGHWQQAMGRKA